MSLLREQSNTEHTPHHPISSSRSASLAAVHRWQETAWCRSAWPSPRVFSFLAMTTEIRERVNPFNQSQRTRESANMTKKICHRPTPTRSKKLWKSAVGKKLSFSQNKRSDKSQPASTAGFFYFLAPAFIATPSCRERNSRHPTEHKNGTFWKTAPRCGAAQESIHCAMLRSSWSSQIMMLSQRTGPMDWISHFIRPVQSGCSSLVRRLGLDKKTL